jgi:hypothetical protein
VGARGAAAAALSLASVDHRLPKTRGHSVGVLSDLSEGSLRSDMQVQNGGVNAGTLIDVEPRGLRVNEVREFVERRLGVDDVEVLCVPRLARAMLGDGLRCALRRRAEAAGR